MMNRRRFLYAAAAGAAMVTRVPNAFAQASKYDLIIRGGRVIDTSVRIDAIRARQRRLYSHTFAHGPCDDPPRRSHAAERLVRGRYLLQDDADRLVAQAEASKVLK